MNFDLLEKLVACRGTSGDESRVRDFIIDYVQNNKSTWKVQPELIFGNSLQDSLILTFGEPTTAIYAHIDSIGFTVGYENDLIRVKDGYELVGSDGQGEIDTEIMIIESEEGPTSFKCVSDRIYERGTPLSFKPNFREETDYIQSPHLDNRLGVWVALQVAETMENGAIVFSTYEELGGNSVGYCAAYLLQRFGLRQSLICDITWITEGVQHGNGVAISLRDKGVPRRVFIDRILEIAMKSDITYQLEVESAGGSDGSALQQTSMPIDWCFIGAAEDNVHSPDEKVHKGDIKSMIEMYRLLISEL